MTDDNSITRRSMLAATGTLGITSLAGCLDPSSDSWILSDESGNQVDPSAELRDVKVKEAPTDRSNPYFVAVSDDIMSNSGTPIFDRQQVRLKVQNDVEGEITDPCLYTVTTNPDYTAGEKNTVWMSKEGMNRLGVVDGTLLVLQPHSASSRFDTRDAGEENNELIEQYIENDESNVLFLAPHGGELFSNTELQALRGSSIENYTSWALMGYASSRDVALTRWYNPPEMYNIESFIGLSSLQYPFNYAVSFTGLNKADDATNKEIVIGGLAEDELKTRIKSQLEDEFTPGSNTENSENTSDETQSDSTQTQQEPTVTVSVSYEGELSASEPQYITNNLSDEDANGVVIQQTKPVRDQHWKEVTDAVMTALENHRD